jgi:mannitol/fructose-specific phosphotransferase system IIA component (Ntr-type)/predicted RNA-binding Zn-ribbon protein involved in translation (DUF1610 family)
MRSGWWARHACRVPRACGVGTTIARHRIFREHFESITSSDHKFTVSEWMRHAVGENRNGQASHPVPLATESPPMLPNPHRQQLVCPLCRRNVSPQEIAAAPEHDCPVCGDLRRFVQSRQRQDLPFLVADAVECDASASDKASALGTAVSRLVKSGVIEATAAPSILADLLKREQLASTGVGRSIAIPHIRHPAVDRVIGTIVRLRQGLAYECIDGESVRVLFVVISPAAEPAAHLRAVSAIARALLALDVGQ